MLHHNNTTFIVKQMTAFILISNMEPACIIICVMVHESNGS